ncbi:unnamed protein product [Fusarium venenatum]|uniref:Uncharacterized protein n=1 Tax=Fusarium venenatum TaxID=56646 RepID=A0A2L2U438_9HYPO|nr:uncharacterized protein FVRRES_11007 [Fusarium venenatum]CEI70930.1 unnamed protein product [Fusarium venenatum]
MAGEFSFLTLQPSDKGGNVLCLELDNYYDDLIEEHPNLDFKVLPRNIYDGPTVNGLLSAGDSTASDAAWAKDFQWYHECLSPCPG